MRLLEAGAEPKFDGRKFCDSSIDLDPGCSSFSFSIGAVYTQAKLCHDSQTLAACRLPNAHINMIQGPALDFPKSTAKRACNAQGLRRRCKLLSLTWLSYAEDWALEYAACMPRASPTVGPPQAWGVMFVLAIGGIGRGGGRICLWLYLFDLTAFLCPQTQSDHDRYIVAFLTEEVQTNMSRSLNPVIQTLNTTPMASVAP